MMRSFPFSAPVAATGGIFGIDGGGLVIAFDPTLSLRVVEFRHFKFLLRDF